VSLGTPVVILSDKREYDENGSWLAILPTAQEVRYLRATAVKVLMPVESTSAAVPVPPTPAPVALQETVAPPSPASAVAPPPLAGQLNRIDPLWLQAEQAERANDVVRAESLYQELARKTTDHDLAMRCYNRLHFLRSGDRGSVPPGYQPDRPAEASGPTPPASDQRLVPAPSNPVPPPPASVAPPPAPPPPQYTYIQDQQRPPLSPTSSVRNVAPPSAPMTNGPAAPATPVSQWSEPGYLRQTAVTLGKLEVYALVSDTER